MTYNSTFSLFRLLCNIFMFTLGYLTLGSIALFLILFSANVEVLIENGWNFDSLLLGLTDDPYALLSPLRSQLMTSIPFDEVADKLFDNSGMFVNVFIGTVAEEKLSLEDFTASLFPDTVKIAIAGFLIHLFNKLKFAMTSACEKNIFGKLGGLIAGGLLGVAAFSVASATLTVIDHHYEAPYSYAVYVAAAAACVVLHSAVLSFVGPQRIPMKKTGVFLITNLLFGVLNSILCWRVCFNFSGFYDLEHPIPLLVTSLIFSLVMMLEEKLCVIILNFIGRLGIR